LAFVPLEPVVLLATLIPVDAADVENPLEPPFEKAA
jgi:hypothetical protein